jgi:thiosulfate reductase cytochrome b subunit
MTIHDEAAAPAAAIRTVLTRRHSAVTRITHWINVLCLTVLLLSGLQILNAYPSLHWGAIGADADPYLARIAQVGDGEAQRGVLRVGKRAIDVTGVLGVSQQDGEQVARAFPAWITLPSGQDLAAGRRWHFFFAWLFVANGLTYLATALALGHFRRDLLPSLAELRPGHLWQEVRDHARLRFPKGEAARRYNALQKLTYLAVIVVLLPLMLLTGLTMSPAIDAAAPFLLDLFGGRPSARTIHFAVATLLVAFVVVHVLMVLLSGAWNNMRSMITGQYAIKIEGAGK